MNYEILEHTADIKIRAFGKDRKELFLNMLKGILSVIGNETEGKKTNVRKIKIESVDFKALLVDFLNEALYQGQINGEVYIDVNFIEFTDTKIKGELMGKKVNRFKEDIKAATYHNLELRERQDGMWEAVVIFDV